MTTVILVFPMRNSYVQGHLGGGLGGGCEVRKPSSG